MTYHNIREEELKNKVAKDFLEIKCSVRDKKGVERMGTRRARLFTDLHGFFLELMLNCKPKFKKNLCKFVKAAPFALPLFCPIRGFIIEKVFLFYFSIKYPRIPSFLQNRV
ncbi:MAG: hypothetical protein RLZZ628_3793 [Bacteroidota bacterium]|jgi:hypothetical protein